MRTKALWLGKRVSASVMSASRSRSCSSSLASCSVSFSVSRCWVHSRSCSRDICEGSTGPDSSQSSSRVGWRSMVTPSTVAAVSASDSVRVAISTLGVTWSRLAA